MNRRHIVLLVLAVVVSNAAAQAPSESPANRDADHQELRALLQRGTAALNARDFGALAPMFESDSTITTVDGRTFHGVAAFKTYLDQLYATRVESIRFNPTADALTTFFGPDDGVCVGSSTDTYKFKDGDVRTMTSRWTASLHRSDGRWKVSSLHMSANVLDNPVVDAAKRWGMVAAAVALIAGAVAGYVIRLMTSRSA